MNESPGLIYKLIPAVMKEVSAIEKRQKNTQQGYSFRGVDDVMAAFHPALVKHGIFYVPEVLSCDTTERQSANGKTLIYTTLTIAYTFFAEDGSAVRSVVVGEAMDSGDKSSNKAMSAALKYALLQIFCVPTESQEDADYETHEVAPRNQVEDKNLDRSISEACGVLGKREEDLNEYVKNKYGEGRGWKRLSTERKQEVVRMLNKKVDELVKV